MAINVEKFVLGELETNTYIVTETESDVSAVVDPATEDEVLLKALENKNVKYILLTHGHFDHISGAKAVKEKTGAKTVIHKEDADCLKNESKSLFRLMNSASNSKQPVTSADILTENGSLLTFGNTTIRVLHTPGHTKGGVCYIFEKERVIFSGDTLFRLSAGRTDFPDGNAREELMSLSDIAKLDGDFNVYCGHGEDTTLDFERKNNRYVKIR